MDIDRIKAKGYCRRATRTNCSRWKSRIKDTGYSIVATWHEHARPTNGHSESITPPRNTNAHTNTRHNGVQPWTRCRTFNPMDILPIIPMDVHDTEFLHNFTAIHPNIGDMPIKIPRSVSSLQICCPFPPIPFPYHSHLSHNNNKYSLWVSAGSHWNIRVLHQVEGDRRRLYIER